MSRTTFILAAALSTSLAVAPPRRRLRDTVDIGHVRAKAEEEALTGALSFKLDGAAADEQGAGALADHIADLIDCTSAKRVFRSAGKHEAIPEEPRKTSAGGFAP